MDNEDYENFILLLIGILLVGGLFAYGVWRLTKPLWTWLRLIPVTFCFALVFTPGAIVGHGVAYVPVILALANAASLHNAIEFREAFGPLLFVWGITYAVALFLMFIVRFIKRIGRSEPRKEAD